MTSTTNDPTQTTPAPAGTPAGSPGAPGPANDPPEPQGPHHDPESAPSDVSALRHEAASRRRQLREAEAERDALRERVNAHDRQDVERIAARSLADPSDLLSATNLDDLRDESGAVDWQVVDQAIVDLIQRKPHYAKPAPPIPPTADLHAGPRQTVPRPPSLGEAMKRQIGRRG